MPVLKIADLTAHPKNEYYFDDIQGDGWNDLLQSVRTSGVTNAITVTKDGVIISGHQRVRACKLLGIEEIPAHVVEYTPEEQEKHKDVKDLIESNLKQRVPGNSNPVKLGRCFAFLEEYYNIKQGKKPQNAVIKTQDSLAAEYGISTDALQRMKKLSSAIPEMQELLDTGKVNKSTAIAIMRQLSEEEQREFAQQVADEKKVSAKVAEGYIATLKAQSRREAKQECEAEMKALRQTNKVLKEQAEKTATVVAPEDYEQTKKQVEMLEADNERLSRERKEAIKELQDTKKTLEAVQSPDANQKVVDEAKDSFDNFAIATYNYIRRYGGFVWAFDKWADVPADTKKNFEKAVQALSAFSQQMVNNVGGLE